MKNGKYQDCGAYTETPVREGLVRGERDQIYRLRAHALFSFLFDQMAYIRWYI